jgi:hypothetical protein
MMLTQQAVMKAHYLGQIATPVDQTLGLLADHRKA